MSLTKKSSERTKLSAGFKKVFLCSAVFILILSGCGHKDNQKINLELENELSASQALYEANQENLNNEINQEEAKLMPKAKITTSLGEIIIELDAKKAPVSTQNFRNYAESGYYNNTLFHRVMPGFMIQGGGFDKDKNQKDTNSPIINEAKNGLKNNRGTLAMARTNEVNSATSQFFINLVDNDFLNYQSNDNFGYAVFGQVVEGMEVVDLIAQAETSTFERHENWPVENIVIEKIEMMVEQEQ